MLEAERDIIEKAKQGDAVCFGRLYDHYVPVIYRFVAARITVREEAEDLTHEVFLSAWQNLPRYSSQGFPFSSWLYRIARNRIIDHYRTDKHHASLDDPQQELGERLVKAATGQEERLDQVFSLERVQAAIRQLTPDQQDVIILRFVEDLTPAEIAIVLKKREGSVRIIQHRAVTMLRQLLQ